MISKKSTNFIKTVLLISDILLLNGSFIIALVLRHGNIDKIRAFDAQVILLVANLIWVTLSSKYVVYNNIRVGQISNSIIQAIKITILHSVIILAFLLLLKFTDVSRLCLFYFYSTLLFSVSVSRFILIRALKYFKKIGFNVRNVVIVGLNNSGMQMHTHLSKDLSLGCQVLGFFEDFPFENTKNLPILGGIKNVKTYITQNTVDEVHISSLNYQADIIKEIIETCENNFIRVKIIPEFNKYTKNRNVSIDFYGSLPVISLREEPLENSINKFLKRTFDIGFSLLFFICIAIWLFPVIMVMLKLSSKGPIFFKQERSGENNTIFICYKFRSMKINAEAHIKQASKHDERITKVGKFLRKTNLDELPQFINVLKGNMSVVGPRPHMLKHTEEYSSLIKNYLVRHYVKPGITGWAQVHGLRGETSELEQMSARVDFDIWYIEHWTFLLDLRIIVSTVVNMFKGEENAG